MEYKKKKDFFTRRINIRFFSILTIILICLSIIGAIVTYKLFFEQKTVIYVKVKMGQGYWWADAGLPPIWYTNAIRKGQKQKDILGNPEAEVLSVTKYPAGNFFNQFVIVKLQTDYDAQTSQYKYNRSLVAIGSPIQIPLGDVMLTGTVIALNTKPFNSSYVTKTITLLKQGAYLKDSPYQFDQIIIGDKYFNGEDYVFEVLDKKLDKSIWTITNNLTGSISEQEVTTTQNIVIKAKVKTQKISNSFYYAEESKLALNAGIFFATANYQFPGYYIINIE